MDEPQTIFDNDIIEELYQTFKSKKGILREMKEKLKHANISLQGIAPLLEPDVYKRLLTPFLGS